MKIQKSFFFIFFAFLTFSVSAKIKFENPQINSENKILYTVECNSSSDKTENYKTLFLTDAEKSSKNIENSKILTCFPEKMQLLSGGSVLQIENRYGTARYSVRNETLTWILQKESLPTQAKGFQPSSSSSSGKWICTLEKTSAAKGRLILKNAFTSQTYILDEHADFDFEKIPVKWAPEREILLYEKNSGIYFCDPKAWERNMQMSDEFRKIGEGSINSVQWANSKYFFYIKDDLIYKISADELYTRAVYSNIVGEGIVVGKLPLKFNPNKDKFSINPNSDKIAVIKSNSLVSIYEIDGTSSKNVSVSFSKPFSSSKGTILNVEIFWTKYGKEILWVNFLGANDGIKKSCAYRISDSASPYISLAGTFEDAKNPELSPDGKKLAFASKNHLYIYEINRWKLLGDLSGEKFISYAWKKNSKKDEIFAGGNSTVRKFSSNENGKFDGNGTVLFLSSVESAFWKPGTKNTITAQTFANDATFYDYDSSRNIWRNSADDLKTSFEFMKKAADKAQIVQNEKFRVYAGPTDNPVFENALYIRKLTGENSTFPVFKESIRKSPELRHIALAFDALDNADGIPEILSVLNDYKIKATFFLNGEFIKRYPAETKQILSCGHDCASMFFTTADFREKGYVIDEEFIRRGLARNEDEFFAATGAELSLLWHAPFYSANEKIKFYGEKSGYKYIDMSRLSLDTTTFESDKNHYLDASELVEFFVENAEDKMIIPISTGISSGTRNDFLYEKLSLLIEDLRDEGFKFSLIKDFK